MYDAYLTTAEKIRKNKKVNGKIMSIPQLETMIKICCRYEYKPVVEAITVKQATEEITRAMNQIKKGKIAQREKMYKYDDLMAAYINKYPAVYKAIQDRYKTL